MRGYAILAGDGQRGDGPDAVEESPDQKPCKDRKDQDDPTLGESSAGADGGERGQLHGASIGVEQKPKVKAKPQSLRYRIRSRAGSDFARHCGGFRSVNSKLRKMHHRAALPRLPASTSL